MLTRNDTGEVGCSIVPFIFNLLDKITLFKTGSPITFIVHYHLTPIFPMESSIRKPQKDTRRVASLFFDRIV